MGRYVIDTRARSEASPHEVFALLADGRRWPDWGVWTGFEVETPGEGVAEGPGAVRVLTSKTFGRTVVSRERVVEVVPDRRLAYALLSGLPLRGYRGQVDLTLEPDGGTLVRWHSEFDGAALGSGWFYRLVLSRFIADAAVRLARYAERPVAA
jgi:uncharacterized protein YndB with AHSA1/START domain